MRIVGNLGDDHEEGVTIVFFLADDRDTTLLQRHVFGLLRDLHVCASLLLDLLDVIAGLADYHTGCAVWYQDFHLNNDKIDISYFLSLLCFFFVWFIFQV